MCSQRMHSGAHWQHLNTLATLSVKTISHTNESQFDPFYNEIDAVYDYSAIF